MATISATSSNTSDTSNSMIQFIDSVISQLPQNNLEDKSAIDLDKLDISRYAGVLKEIYNPGFLEILRILTMTANGVYISQQQGQDGQSPKNGTLKGPMNSNNSMSSKSSIGLASTLAGSEGGSSSLLEKNPKKIALAKSLKKRLYNSLCAISGKLPLTEQLALNRMYSIPLVSNTNVEKQEQDALSSETNLFQPAVSFFISTEEEEEVTGVKKNNNLNGSLSPKKDNEQETTKTNEDVTMGVTDNKSPSEKKENNSPSVVKAQDDTSTKDDKDKTPQGDGTTATSIIQTPQSATKESDTNKDDTTAIKDPNADLSQDPKKKAAAESVLGVYQSAIDSILFITADEFSEDLQKKLQEPKLNRALEILKKCKTTEERCSIGNTGSDKLYSQGKRNFLNYLFENSLEHVANGTVEHQNIIFNVEGFADHILVRIEEMALQLGEWLGNQRVVTASTDSSFGCSANAAAPSSGGNQNLSNDNLNGSANQQQQSASSNLNPHANAQNPIPLMPLLQELTNSRWHLAWGHETVKAKGNLTKIVKTFFLKRLGTCLDVIQKAVIEAHRQKHLATLNNGQTSVNSNLNPVMDSKVNEMCGILKRVFFKCDEHTPNRHLAWLGQIQNADEREFIKIAKKTIGRFRTRKVILPGSGVVSAVNQAKLNAKDNTDSEDLTDPDPNDSSSTQAISHEATHLHPWPLIVDNQRDILPSRIHSLLEEERWLNLDCCDFNTYKALINIFLGKDDKIEQNYNNLSSDLGGAGISSVTGVNRNLLLAPGSSSDLAHQSQKENSTMIRTDSKGPIPPPPISNESTEYYLHMISGKCLKALLKDFFQKDFYFCGTSRVCLKGASFVVKQKSMRHHLNLNTAAGSGTGQATASSANFTFNTELDELHWYLDKIYPKKIFFQKDPNFGRHMFLTFDESEVPIFLTSLKKDANILVNCLNAPMPNAIVNMNNNSNSSNPGTPQSANNSGDNNNSNSSGSLITTNHNPNPSSSLMMGFTRGNESGELNLENFFDKFGDLLVHNLAPAQILATNLHTKASSISTAIGNMPGGKGGQPMANNISMNQPGLGQVGNNNLPPHGLSHGQIQQQQLQGLPPPPQPVPHGSNNMNPNQNINLASALGINKPPVSLFINQAQFASEMAKLPPYIAIHVSKLDIYDTLTWPIVEVVKLLVAKCLSSNVHQQQLTTSIQDFLNKAVSNPQTLSKPLMDIMKDKINLAHTKGNLALQKGLIPPHHHYAYGGKGQGSGGGYGPQKGKVGHNMMGGPYAAGPNSNGYQNNNMNGPNNMNGGPAMNQNPNYNNNVNQNLNNNNMNINNMGPPHLQQNQQNNQYNNPNPIPNIMPVGAPNMNRNLAINSSPNTHNMNNTNNSMNGPGPGNPGPQNSGSLPGGNNPIAILLKSSPDMVQWLQTRRDILEKVQVAVRTITNQNQNQQNGPPGVGGPPNANNEQAMQQIITFMKKNYQDHLDLEKAAREKKERELQQQKLEAAAQKDKESDDLEKILGNLTKFESLSTGPGVTGGSGTTNLSNTNSNLSTTASGTSGNSNSTLNFDNLISGALNMNFDSVDKEVTGTTGPSAKQSDLEGLQGLLKGLKSSDSSSSSPSDSDVNNVNGGVTVAKAGSEVTTDYPGQQILPDHDPVISALIVNSGLQKRQTRDVTASTENNVTGSGSDNQASGNPLKQPKVLLGQDDDEL